MACPLSKAEICKILPDVSPTTVEAVLGIMVKEGLSKRSDLQNPCAICGYS